MLATFANVGSTLSHSWKYSQKKIEESPEWKEREIVIIAAKNTSSKSLHNQSWFLTRVVVALSALYTMTLHSVRLSKSSVLKCSAVDLSQGMPKGHYRSLVQIHSLSKQICVVTDPNIIRAVLMHERNEVGPDALFSGGIPAQTAKIILGENLLSCSAPEHEVLRKTISRYFDYSRIKTLYPQIQKDILDLLNEWVKTGTDGKIKPSKALSDLNIRLVCSCLLGYQKNIKPLSKAMETVLGLFAKSNKSINEKQQYSEAIQVIESAAGEAVESAEKDSLLGAILHAPSLGRSDAVRMAKLMFFGGADTTASSVCFALYILGQNEHKNFQENLFTESLNTEYMDPEKYLSNSSLLQNIFKEVFRLHPAAFVQTREVLKDIIIDEKWCVPSGTELNLMHYYSLRDERRWGSDAHAFNPARHAITTNQGDKSKLDRGPWQVFSEGPASCLGRSFAMLWMKGFIHEINKQYQWEARQKLEQDGYISLSLIPELEICLNKRKISMNTYTNK